MPGCRARVRRRDYRYGCALAVRHALPDRRQLQSVDLRSQRWHHVGPRRSCTRVRVDGRKQCVMGERQPDVGPGRGNGQRVGPCQRGRTVAKRGHHCQRPAAGTQAGRRAVRRPTRRFITVDRCIRRNDHDRSVNAGGLPVAGFDKRCMGDARRLVGPGIRQPDASGAAEPRRRTWRRGEGWQCDCPDQPGGGGRHTDASQSTVFTAVLVSR